MYQWIIRLRRLPAWPLAALLVVGLLVSNAGFDWRQDQLGCGVDLLDVRAWYSPEEARHLFEQLGEEGRRLYAITQVTLDLAFPLVYGTLFILLMVQLYRDSQARWLVWVPLITLLADLLENGLAAYLAWTFDGDASAASWAAAVFTAVKRYLFVATLLVLLAGGVAGLGRQSGHGQDR